jgi:hypothetical protein
MHEDDFNRAFLRPVETVLGHPAQATRSSTDILSVKNSWARYPSPR